MIVLISDIPLSGTPGDPVYGTRSGALGNAGVAAGLGPSSVFLNPAAAISPGSSGIEAGYMSLYAVDGTFDGYVAAMYVQRRFAGGIAWHQRRLEDLYHEDRIQATLSYSPVDAGFQAGLSLTAIYSALSGRTGYSSNDTPQLNIDAGCIVDLGRIAFGLSCINILKKEYSLLAQGGIPYKIHPAVTTGIRFTIAEGFAGAGTATLLADMQIDGTSTFRPRTGIECSFYNMLNGRIGIFEGDFVGGGGIDTPWFSVDLTVRHNDILEDSFQLSLRIPGGHPGQESLKNRSTTHSSAL
jgi:hypothetical protein